MAYLSDESKELRSVMTARGLTPEFSELIAKELNTPWTAKRMIGYLRHLPVLREEDIVDEMLGILADRDRIRQKKELEYAQSVINEMYMKGFEADEDC